MEQDARTTGSRTPDVERAGHPRLAGAVLMIAVVVLLVLLALLSI